MKHAVLTLDYELYGNGSGDVFKHVIEPTEAILKVLNEKNVKMTIFVEIVEFLRIKQEWDNGNNMGYSSNPYDAVVAQLQQAALDGHDIQLHIHPQWVNAKYENNKWHVDHTMWRLGEYDGDMIELLLWGKTELEKIMRPILPDYKCIALRAGGYNAQPSERIVLAMREIGLQVDSSIVPGAIEHGALSRYDYSLLPLNVDSWHVVDKLDSPQAKGEIFELPVTSFPVRRYRKYISKDRLSAIFRNRKSAIESYNSKTTDNENHSLFSTIFKKVKYFFEYENQTWDYCLFTKSLHRIFVERITSQKDRNIVTLVGHPKSYSGSSGLIYLIDSLSRNNSFITITQFLDNRLCGSEL